VFLPFIYAPLIVLPATLSGPPAGGMDIAAKLSVAELVSTIATKYGRVWHQSGGGRISGSGILTARRKLNERLSQASL
jgi:hypothetical protein